MCIQSSFNCFIFLFKLQQTSSLSFILLLLRPFAGKIKIHKPTKIIPSWNVYVKIKLCKQCLNMGQYFANFTTLLTFFGKREFTCMFLFCLLSWASCWAGGWLTWHSGIWERSTVFFSSRFFLLRDRWSLVIIG